MLLKDTRLRRSGLAQQGVINADAAIRISVRSDYDVCVSVCLSVCTRTGFMLHYRTWWVRSPFTLWSTQTLFDVCCVPIIYLSGEEFSLTQLFLHSYLHSNTLRGVKPCVRFLPSGKTITDYVLQYVAFPIINALNSYLFRVFNRWVVSLSVSKVTRYLR